MSIETLQRLKYILLFVTAARPSVFKLQGKFIPFASCLLNRINQIYPDAFPSPLFKEMNQATCKMYVVWNNGNHFVRIEQTRVLCIEFFTIWYVWRNEFSRDWLCCIVTWKWFSLIYVLILKTGFNVIELHFSIIPTEIRVYQLPDKIWLSCIFLSDFIALMSVGVHIRASLFLDVKKNSIVLQYNFWLISTLWPMSASHLNYMYCYFSYLSSE